MRVTASAELLDLLQQWRDTTLVEGQAIAHSQWDTVAACQARKNEWMRDWPFPPLDVATAPPLVRALMEEIVALERRNYEQLTLGLENTRQQLEALGQSRQQLRQLRRAYSASHPPAWESWS